LSSTLLKYFLKRWTWPLVGGVLFFGGLILAYDMVRTSKEIFALGAPIRWLIPLLLTTVPETLAMVLPMAALLGGLIGTQQLSEGSEMVASQGLGAGLGSLLKPWAFLSLGLVVVATINAHLIVPRVGTTVDQLQQEMIEETKTRFLRPGGAPFFPPKEPQSGVWVAPNGEIHLFEVSEDSVQHLLAKEFNWKKEDRDVDKSAVVLELKDIKVCRYEKASKKVGLLNQESQPMRIDLPSRPRILKPTPARYESTGQLLMERSPDAWVELSRRITLPFSAAALLLLGISLGLDHPRFRQGGALLRSLGVILVYYMVMKYLENDFQVGNRSPVWLFCLPLLFLGAGISLLVWKTQPHRVYWFSLSRVIGGIGRTFLKVKTYVIKKMGLIPAIPYDVHLVSKKTRSGILGKWTRRLWWKNWGAAMGTLLILDLLLEFAPLAGELSQNGVPISVFLRYWVWNLPAFLALAFPMSFLLGGVMSLSDAAISREWVAMRAGGASLLQWIGSGTKAWISIVFVTFVLQAIAAPAMKGRADDLYQEIRKRPQHVYESKPWMHLTSTGVLWFLEKDYRWGFPLRSPGEAPILYRWKRGDARADELPWDSLDFQTGPASTSLFPDKALRNSASAEETSTLDLVQWQKWAPDPERGSMLWERLLNWLAGPCLLFAMLAFAFPAPRRGRGQVLGFSLVAGLLFLGMQALFGGAAHAGEIPAPWGVLAPLLFLVGIGFSNLHRLRT
jgi:lipopolysaccharide export LptBFGC system permease protein LptF